MKKTHLSVIVSAILLLIVIYQFYELSKLRKELVRHKVELLRKSESNDSKSRLKSRINKLENIPYSNKQRSINSSTLKPTPKSSRNSGGISEADRRGFRALGDRAKGYVKENLTHHYDTVFNDLGISNEDKEDLLEHLGNVESVQAEATQYLIKVKQSKDLYDKKLRNILDEEQYKKYLNTEKEKFAKTEIRKVNEFLVKKGLNIIDDKDFDIYKEALKIEDAYIATVKQGPYGGDPEVGVGNLGVVEVLRDKIDKIESNSSQVLAKAKEMGIGAETWENLVEFYADLYMKTENEIKLLEHRMQFPDRHRAIIEASGEKQQEMIDQLEKEIGISNIP